MLFQVKVEKEVLIEIDEKLYTKDVIEQVRGYWDLQSYDDKEVLKYVAENIGHNLMQGIAIESIEGIHSNSNAHNIMQETQNIEVYEAEIAE